MRFGALPGGRGFVVALALTLAPLPAVAQETGGADYALAAPAANAAAQSDAPPAPPPLTPDEAALLGQALLFDPASLVASAPAKPLRLPSLGKPRGLALSRTDRPDGSATVVVKQPLPTDWDAKIGADLGLAANPPITYRPDTPLTVKDDGATGAAWASLGVTDYATVAARVDPSNDQGRLAGTLKRAIPVGADFAVTLENSSSVTEAFGAPATGAPSGLPLIALPQDTGSAAPSQVWGHQQAVKFDILATGTTLAAGRTSSSTDPVTHNRLSAEQKLLGRLHVTTAVSDLGQPVTNKSISAGFKFNW